MGHAYMCDPSPTISLRHDWVLCDPSHDHSPTNDDDDEEPEAALRMMMTMRSLRHDWQVHPPHVVTRVSEYMEEVHGGAVMGSAWRGCDGQCMEGL